MRVFRRFQSVAEWRRQRVRTLRAMQEVMGPLPPESRKVPLRPRVLEEVRTGQCLRRKISLETERNDRSGLCRVPAWVLIPRGLNRPAAGMLCLHQTTPSGKDQPVGLSKFPQDSPDLRYAAELAARGYVTISPDYPTFGELASTAYARGYASVTMNGIWNHSRALDVLASMPEVDPRRLGVIGHSLGGHNALFVAAFDKRIRAVVTSCGFTSFARYRGGNLAAWSQDRYMPRIGSRYHNDPAKMPFDFSDVLGALAPRLVLINAPIFDTNFDPAGVRDCVRAARAAWRLFGSEETLVVEYPKAGHSFPGTVRRRFYDKLDAFFDIGQQSAPPPHGGHERRVSRSILKCASASAGRRVSSPIQKVAS